MTFTSYYDQLFTPNASSSSTQFDHAHKEYLGFLTNLSVLTISGQDAKLFLQGQFTSDLNQLQPKVAHLSAYCDYKGRVLANFWIWPYEEGYALLIPQIMSNTVQEHLKKYALLSKITVKEDLDWQIILHYHPNDLLREHEGIIIGHLATAQATHQLTWLMAKSSMAPKIITELESRTALIDTNGCSLLHILSGFSFIQPPTSLLFTPQMLNLEKLGAVSFRKGCYVGQEVIARTQNLGKLKRHLYHCLINNNELPEPGAALQNSHHAIIGTIINAAKVNEAYIALAVIQDDAAQHAIYNTGAEVTILS